YGKGINEIGLVAHLLFLVARGSPVVGYALRQRICGKLLHFCQCLAGAELRGCRPEDGCGRVEIVAGDQLRAFLTLYIQQGTQWDHTSRLVADIEALMSLGSTR